MLLHPSKTCTICSHPNRLEIDDALVVKEPLRKIAARFLVGRQALVRHSRHESRQLAPIPGRAKHKLTPRQQALVRELTKPQPVSTAMLKAGYSESTSRNGIAGATQSKEVQRFLEETIRGYVPVEVLAQRLRESLDATQTKFFAREGRVVDERTVIDFAERRAAVELSARLGYLNDKVSQESLLQVVEVTQEDLTDKLMTRLQVLSARTKA